MVSNREQVGEDGEEKIPLSPLKVQLMSSQDQCYSGQIAYLLQISALCGSWKFYLEANSLIQEIFIEH